MKDDLVILLHGFAARRFLLKPLAARLHMNGFRVQTWNYPSIFTSIPALGASFAAVIRERYADEPRVHLVAHSMGSIVVRAALSDGIPANVGRIVFLAPPNQGSPIARWTRILGRFIPPIAELSTSPDSYVNRLAPLSLIEIGILAARFDHMVPASRTHLSEAKTHRTLYATHNSLLWQRTTGDLTASFLRTGEFSKKHP